MKNYSGYIFGNSKDKYWTQTLNKHTKNKFYNPLRQNYAHQKALEDYLNIDNTIIISVVIFNNNSNFKKLTLNINDNVIHLSSLNKFIKKTKGNKKISEEKTNEYLNLLEIKTNTDNNTKLKHINDIEEYINK